MIEGTFRELDWLHAPIRELHINSPYYRGLSELPANLEVLRLENSSLVSLKGIEHLTELKELYLDGNRKMTDFSALAGLPRLSVLSLRKNGTVIRLPLASLTQLTHLSIQDSELRNGFNQLPRLKHLETLFLECYLESLPDLNGMTALRHITLSKTPIKRLPALPPLDYLALWNNQDLDDPGQIPTDVERLSIQAYEIDISSLPEGVAWLELNASYIPRLADALGRMPDLRELHLTRLKTTRLDGLVPEHVEVLHLKRLDLLSSLSFLEKLPRLHTLSIGGTRMLNRNAYASIQNLRQLRELSLSDCAELMRLQLTLPELHTLHLSKNSQLTHLDFEGSIGLTRLYLADNGPLPFQQPEDLPPLTSLVWSNDHDLGFNLGSNGKVWLTFDTGGVRQILEKKHLVNINLSYNSSIRDITTLYDHHQLRTLELENTAVRDLTGLGRLVQLESLDLRDTDVSLRNLPGSISSLKVSAGMIR